MNTWDECEHDVQDLFLSYFEKNHRSFLDMLFYSHIDAHRVRGRLRFECRYATWTASLMSHMMFFTYFYHIPIQNSRRGAGPLALRGPASVALEITQDHAN